MTVKEEGLRRRIGSEYIIGCYTIKDGQACFTDIRGEEGDIVKISSKEQSDIEVKYSGKPLQEGQFYRFLWKLADNDEDFVIIGEAEEIDNVKFLQGIFDARLKLNGSNLELFINFQRTIFNEVTGARQTFIYELLQNANDYPYKEEDVAVQFIVSDHYLFFFHTGDYFNLRNIVGISSINQGEKAKNKETIGYKGIGFKTVFGAKNEFVYLRSGKWSLRFDRAYSEKMLSGECPWALMPIPTDFNELDKEAQLGLKSAPQNMRVQFALRHNYDARENIEQLDHVFGDDQILLFIPHVYKVEVIVDGKKRHVVEKDEKKWIVDDYSCPISAELKDWVEKSIKNGERVPEKFKNIDRARISFAVAKDNRKIIPIENARVYNYLPTELRLGFKFLFNADFIPDGSRSGLHNVLWNDYVMELCGYTFSKWWKSLLIQDEKGDLYDLETVCNILPDNTNSSNYGRLFLEGFHKGIMEIACIPTVFDNKYELQRINNVLLDVSGVVSSQSPLFTDEEFYEFSGTKYYLPHKDIRCNSRLKNLLRHFKETKIYSGHDLTGLCNNKDFIVWLSKRENNLRFIGFVVQHGYIDNFWNYAIFLRTDGTLGRADNTYYDIDKYIEDLDFLGANLPRLDIEIRKQLTSLYKEWPSYSRKFKAFQEFQFTRNIFQNFSNVRPKLFNKDNSIKFIHFLATTHYISGVPEDFPLCLSDNRIVSRATNIFQQSDEGLAFASHNWVQKEWIQFLHNDYFFRDKEEIQNYLSLKCNIIKLNQIDCYKRFIADEKYIEKIAKNIKTFENNKDFFLYLSEIQEEIGNLPTLIREAFPILTTDGKTEDWTPITKTIFWRSEEWHDKIKLPWVPERCCLAVSEKYFLNLNNHNAALLRKLFASKQIAYNFSVQAFYQNCLRGQMKEVFALIKTKEISKNFLNFIYEYRTSIFRNNVIDSVLSNVPILLRGENELFPISSIKSDIYVACPEIEHLYNQPWFIKNYIAVCDDSYIDLFESRERREFFEKLGIANFYTISFVRDKILGNLDVFEEKLKEREANVAFHRFFSDINDLLSEKEMESIMDMPVYISSPNEEKGVLSELSTNHYLPSEELTQIINLDLVPISILDSIHPDYIVTEKDIRYFEDKLGNVTLTVDGFINYIVQDEPRKKVEIYIRDTNRNIKFWQWACREQPDNRKLLKVFPMICRNKNSEKEEFKTPDQLYISNCYIDYDIEEIVSDYVPDAYFVSSCYLDNIQEFDKYNWKALFRELRVTVDNKDIIFKDVIPNLRMLKKLSIVSSLAQYTDEIIKKLKDNDEKMLSWIAELQLLCSDNIWRRPTECLASGGYYGLEFDPIPEIVIPNLITEQYIEECKDNDELRTKVVRFISMIANYYGNGLNSLTKLRDSKIKYFVENQERFKNDESHFTIIAQLAKAFNEDFVGISLLFDNLSYIHLYSTSGKFLPSSELYLSSCYNPTCDYMAYNVTELDYVSEKYAEESEESMNRFFAYLEVKDDFSEKNLDQLRILEFANYFWQKFAPYKESKLKNICTEENLKNIPCIPSAKGIKKPCELYDYRIPSLKKMLMKLEGGEEKLPSIELPLWMDSVKIGLRNKLFLPDCIEYLKLNTVDFRRDVINWILEAPSETHTRFKGLIDAYIDQALWLNGEKQWVPLKNLYALEWENKTLNDNFSGNAYICNPSYMPEYKSQYDRLCALFNIRILTDSDFKKRKDGKHFKDVEAINEIRKRLLYLAYKYSADNWKELFEEYLRRLNAADISQCEKIAYFFNDNIETDLLVYADDEKYLWYVDSWKGSMFLDVLSWIEHKIGIKGNFDNNFMRKLFLNKFDEFVMKQDGGLLPQELLDFLDEEEKKSIKADELANAESFVEEFQQSERRNMPEGIIENDSDEEDFEEDEIDEEENGEYIEVEDNEKEVKEPTPSGHERPKDRIVPTDFAGKRSEQTLPAHQLGFVDGHHRDGCWVNDYVKEDGTFVSGHWRGDAIVSPHTRENTTNGGSGHSSSLSSSKDKLESDYSPSIRQISDVEDRFTSVEDDSDYDKLGQRPHKPRTRREPKQYSSEDVERMRSHGTPLELESLPATEEEIDVLGQNGISPDQIADTNHLAQLRLYQYVRDNIGEEPEETLRDFIHNASDVTVHPLKGGKYLHTCSAARGVMYISPSVWNKMVDDKWAICVYLNGQASKFAYIRSKEEFLKLVEKDDVVIKITGKEKVALVNELYTGLLKGARSTAYTLIRVAARTNMDAVFAHYIGSMAEKEDGYDYTDDL